MPSVGYATLQVIPSVRGIGDELRRQLLGPASDAADQAGEQSGSRFGEKWKQGLAAAGAAAGAVLVAATVSAVEKERMADKLSAQLGLTGRGAKQAGKIAGDLYSGAVVESFEDGAAAVRAVMGSGLIDDKATTKSIKAITTQVADLANTFEQDLVGTTNAATQLIRTGLAKDAPAALDLLTAGLQSSADKGGDFLETINEYSTQFRKAGLDGATAVGLLNQAIRAGARDSDIAADAIKEFSIRAIDGSDSSSAGFKALGLSAKDMAAQFAQGGEAANGVLDVTLDKLRGVKDPVKQSQIAVQLFGTQAEDLGASLLAMDPSSAAAELGQFGGAAKRVGDTIRGNTSTELKVLQRQLMGVVGGVVTSVVLPGLRGLNDALAWTGRAAGATGRWFQQWGAWLLPVIVLVGGLTIALNAQAISTAAVTAVFSIYRAAILAGTAVTQGFAIAQAFLNSVMALNPITLIVIALVALGVALVVAYKKSETFRGIVQAVWKGIQTAALWAWNNVLKPVFAALVVAWQEAAKWALWLWRSVLQPVIGFIVTAFKWWWTAAKIYFTAVGVVFYTLGAVAVWLWKNAIWPVIGWIIGGFKLWWAGVKLYFSLVGAGFRAVGAVAMWLWRNAIWPVIGFIIGGFKLWWAGVKIYFNLVKGGFRAVGAGATWLWKNAIMPAWNGIKTGISTVYNVGIKPVLAALRTAVGKTGDAFGAAKDAIKVAWDKVKGIAKAPVEFVVDTVYNRGLVGVWNKVASAFGAPKLSKYKFARGGPVFGAGTETSDDVPAWLSKNEHVWTAKEVRGAGGHGAVMALRKWAAAGGRGRPGFADGGGLFGWVGSAASTAKGWGSDAWEAVKSGAKWLKDTLADSARSGVNTVVKPLLRGIPHLDSGIGKMIAKVPTAMIDALFGYAEKADKKGASQSSAGFGGGQIPTGKRATIIRRALQAAGVPPPGTIGQWLAGMNTLITRESGWNASAVNRWDINAKNGVPSQGLAQTIPPTWSAYVPKSLRSRGILDPVGNVAAAIRYIVARYGNITRVQQANANAAPKGYAGGGRPRPGEMFWVGERGPELMQLGAHGATVWDSATSMRMASGLGVLKGFAKGTSGAQTKAAKAQAAVRKEIAGDLTGVTKALTASAADIKKAFDELTKDLRATGVAGKALAASTVAASVKLQALAKQRDSVDARLEAARSAASDQKKAAADFLGLSQVGEVGTVTDLLGALTSRQATAKTFQQQIAALSKKGLSQDLISQLVAMGPEGALIDLVAGASKGQIGQLNTLAKSGAALSRSYGNTMADAMFDAGTQAGRGFLTGLKAQKKELQKEMTSLGGILVAALEAKLKIKSPAKRTQWTGEMTGLGLQVGLDNTASRVAAAAARVADAAVPQVPTVSPASIAASTPQGLAPGTRLRLVVGEHEFDAYVDDRADDRVNAGFTRVRRAASSGRKQ
jgi:SLT domain-containing protein